MTIEEAMEWCIVHRATIEFSTLWNMEDGERDVVILTPAHRRHVSGYIGTPNFEGLISCVQKAQRAIWGDWKYQREFAKAPRTTEGTATLNANTQSVQ